MLILAWVVLGLSALGFVFIALLRGKAGEDRNAFCVSACNFVTSLFYVVGKYAELNWMPIYTWIAIGSTSLVLVISAALSESGWVRVLTTIIYVPAIVFNSMLLMA